MRRPVVGAFLAFAGGVGFEFYFELNGGFMLALIFACMLFCVYGKKRGRGSFKLLVALFLILFFIGAFWLWHEERVLEINSVTEKLPAQLNGTVISAEEKEEDYYKLLIRVSSVRVATLGTSSGDGWRELENVGNRKILVNIYEDISGLDNLSSLSCYADIVGRKVALNGELSQPQSRRNPRVFDYKLNLKSRGISLTMVGDGSSLQLVQGRAKLAANRIAVFKYSFVDLVEASIGDRELAGLAVGMLLGDKSAIDDDMYESFQRNGTAHILAISGLHIGAIYMCVNACVKTGVMSCNRALRRTSRQGRWVQQLLIMAILVGYAAMTGFVPSVVRAVSMIVLHILSKLLYRRYDMLTAASLVAMVALVLNPFMLFNVGFQLSYLAIFSLSVIMPVVNSIKQNSRIQARLEQHKTVALIIDVFAPIAAIQIGMTPLTAYVFNYFSFGGIIANIPIIFLSGFIIPVGLAMMPAGALISVVPGAAETLLQGAFDMLAFFLKLLINLMEGINGFFYQGGLFSCNVISPSIWFLCLYYGLIFYFSSELARIQFLRKQGGRIAVAAVAVVLVGGMLQAADWIKDDFRDAQMVFVDVGQGDALHIRTPGGKNILIDGGGSVDYDIGKKTLMPYFLKNGVEKIDLAIASHLHTDHYKGLTELSRCMPVEYFGVYEGKRNIESEIASDMAIKPSQIIYLSKGDKIQVDENVYIRIMWPEPVMNDGLGETEGVGVSSGSEYGEEDENASSLIVKVVYEGVSVLMTGDIDCDGERMLMDANAGDRALQSDILKVPHHGSKYSSSDRFIDVVEPRAAVFQVGKNNYGHPNEAVIEKYAKNDIMVYRNDLSGAVGVKDIDGGSFSIVTMLRPKK